MSYCKVTIVGHLGADPDMKYTASGSAVTKIRVATTERFTSKQGEKKERTEWHRITFWGKLAETAAQYLKKGQLVLVEGTLRSDTWEQDGQKRYSYEINGNIMHMLSPGKGANGGQQEEAPAGVVVPNQDMGSIAEDDIPF